MELISYSQSPEKPRQPFPEVGKAFHQEDDKLGRRVEDPYQGNDHLEVAYPLHTAFVYPSWKFISKASGTICCL